MFESRRFVSITDRPIGSIMLLQGDGLTFAVRRLRTTVGLKQQTQPAAVEELQRENCSSIFLFFSRFFSRYEPTWFKNR